MTSNSKGFVSNEMHLWLLLLRQDMKLAQLSIKRLRRRNLESADRVVAGGGPVVSLTTFGARLAEVFLTIESIGLGTLLPSRLILWLQDEETFNRRPDSLKRLESRGLEVCLTKTYGSHSKYYPYVQSQDMFDRPLVTADDDVLYSKWWLAGLASASAEDASIVNCYKARVVHLGDGVVKSYFDWTDCDNTQPSVLHFATGVAGVIYPAALLPRLKQAGDAFLALCPQADDVWLHANAIRAGLRIRQISRKQVDFPVIPGTQSCGLFQTNIWSGRNDAQIKSTYTPQDIARLTGAAEVEAPVEMTSKES